MEIVVPLSSMDCFSFSFFVTSPNIQSGVVHGGRINCYWNTQSKNYFWLTFLKLQFWRIQTGIFFHNHIMSKWNDSQNAFYYPKLLFFLTKLVFIAINFKSDYHIPSLSRKICDKYFHLRKFMFAVIMVKLKYARRIFLASSL